MGKIGPGENHDPQVMEAIANAIALHEKGETSAAVELLLPLAARFPNAASIHGYLASYLLTCRRIDEAVAYGRRAAQLSPGSEIASLVLFHVLEAAAKPMEARTEMKRYLAIRWSEEYAKLLKEQDGSEKPQ